MNVFFARERFKLICIFYKFEVLLFKNRASFKIRKLTVYEWQNFKSVEHADKLKRNDI